MGRERSGQPPLLSRTAIPNCICRLLAGLWCTLAYRYGDYAIQNIPPYRMTSSVSLGSITVQLAKNKLESAWQGRETFGFTLSEIFSV